MRIIKIIAAITVVVTILSSMVFSLSSPDSPQGGTSSWLVLGESTQRAQDLVSQAGGKITHRFSVIDGVAANLNPTQARSLRQQGVKLMPNGSLELAARSVPNVEFTSALNATALHEQAIDGDGVTIAVIDSGMWNNRFIKNDLLAQSRVLARYNAIEDSHRRMQDSTGHGSHITSIMLGSRQADDGSATSVAPMANLVSVKAFGPEGSGSYADIVRAIDWVVANQQAFDIRVLNLSFSAPPRSHYWMDPVNRAVMAAWHCGLRYPTDR